MTLQTMLLTMSTGMLKTCAIFFLTLIGSLPLGMLICAGRRSRNRIVAGIIRIIISVIRGTPLMLQLLVWYFGPNYLFGISIRGWRFPAILVAFIVNYACYFAEIYRGGIDSMPVGQYEAAHVLGYTKSQTFVKIILPQVIKRVLPSITNEFITLIKDTSFAFTLAYSEMFSIAKQISASNTTFTPFVIAGVFYFVANYAVAFGMEAVEKSLQYYD